MIKTTTWVSPLFAVANEYIKEDCPDINPTVYEDLCVTMSQFIQHFISYDFAARKFESLIGTYRSVQRISSILSQCNLPPSSDTRFRQAQALSVLSKKKMHQWTEIEDQRLLSAIHKYGTDNWALVASHLGNTRTRAQCSQRWFRGLDPRLIKVNWNEAEERRLLELVEKYGHHSWMKVASSLGNRSDAQCRYHYYQMMKMQNQDSRPEPKLQLQISMSAPVGALKAAAQSIGIVDTAISDNDLSDDDSERPNPLPPIEEMINNIPKKKVTIIPNFKDFLNSTDPNFML